VYNLHELTHAALDGLYDMRLELRKRVLYADQVLPVIVLLDDLLVQAVHHAAL